MQFLFKLSLRPAATQANLNFTLDFIVVDVYGAISRQNLRSGAVCLEYLINFVGVSMRRWE